MIQMETTPMGFPMEQGDTRAQLVAGLAEPPRPRSLIELLTNRKHTGDNDSPW